MEPVEILTWVAGISSAGCAICLYKLSVHKHAINSMWEQVMELQQDIKSIDTGATVVYKVLEQRVTQLEQAWTEPKEVEHE